MMKKWQLLLSFSICLFFTSGCFFTRFGEAAYSIGVTHYYADGSRIKDNLLYRSGDSNYIFAEELEVEISPDWYALLMHPRNTIRVNGHTGQYVLIALESKTAEYLLADDLESKSCSFRGLVCTTSVDLSGAELLPVKRSFFPAGIWQFCMGEYIDNGIYIRQQKQPVTWFTMPLVLIGYAVDVPVFVTNGVVLVVAAPIIVPICLIVKSLK